MEWRRATVTVVGATSLNLANTLVMLVAVGAIAVMPAAYLLRVPLWIVALSLLYWLAVLRLGVWLGKVVSKDSTDRQVISHVHQTVVHQPVLEDTKRIEMARVVLRVLSEYHNVDPVLMFGVIASAFPTQRAAILDLAKHFTLSQLDPGRIALLQDRREEFVEWAKSTDPGIGQALQVALEDLGHESVEVPEEKEIRRILDRIAA